MRSFRGYTLIEVLVMFVVILLLVALSAKPVQLFFGTEKHIQRAFDCQQQIETMLTQLRRDTENAASAMIQAADERLGGSLLYLSGPEGVVGYRFADGAVTRVEGSQVQEWMLPVKIEWEILTPAADAQALALTIQQRHKYRRAETPVFRGSHLFVVNLNGCLTGERP